MALRVRANVLPPLLEALRVAKPPRYRCFASSSENRQQPIKKEGDISSVFVSLSNAPSEPLPLRYAHLKARLMQGHEDALRDSWDRLLRVLREEISVVAARRSDVVPTVDYADVGSTTQEWQHEVRKRGVCVVKGVVQEHVARSWKEDVREYIKANPQTKDVTNEEEAFPKHDPQVFELYWSKPQTQARAHPNVLRTQRALMSLWHSADSTAPISTNHPVTYADRLRIRNPGDAAFALGPHVDAGSVERWEEEGYGRGHVYDAIWRGEWGSYDPWEASCRLEAVSDRYNGAGACSMFRMFQGWLAMSTTAPNEGTLLTLPLLAPATAYFLLRPFFSPRRGLGGGDPCVDFINPSNWTLDPEPSSALQGATPSQCQEFNDLLHPHLDLPNAMVHVPTVQPGDYVAWHCDAIHAVDKVHAGTTDSSVMYIPACPLTLTNAQYLVRQREAFLNGTPAPDFPGGDGERFHVGRAGVDDLMQVAERDGIAGMGLGTWSGGEGDGLGKTETEREMVRRAEAVLGV
ncbi:MAG: hypothetical protein M1833_003758 [Piccolia ochrophora]|nr:MAG: hypothetical protein M1833_003758 [Piccolia ochrophora]